MMEWENVGKGVFIPATQIERIKTFSSIIGVGDHALTLRESDSFEVRNAIYFHIDKYHSYYEEEMGSEGLGGIFIILNSNSFDLEPSERVMEDIDPYLFVSVRIDEEVWSVENSIKVLEVGGIWEGGYWDDSDFEVAKWYSDDAPIYIIKQAPSFRLINWVSNPFQRK
tara:strand:- start:1305 stop:1808 length:504 start_codon:yes stop_codon:yes gene_type:complete